MKGQIDYCYADVPIGGHKVCVGFRGGIVETYTNEFHFTVDEITSAALVRGRKVRYLRLTGEFAKRLKEIIENEKENNKSEIQSARKGGHRMRGRLKLTVEATAENTGNTPRDKEVIQI